MSNQQNLAYEYALGLLSKEEKSHVELTPEFLIEVEQANLKLSALQLQAPLEQDSSKKIWNNISQQIKSEKESWQEVLASRFRMWLYVLPAVFLAFGSLMLFQQTSQVTDPYSMAIINAKVGWEVNADIDNHKLSIASVSPMLVGKNEVCALWVQKDGVTHFISALPNGGDKIVNMSSKIANLLKGGEMIISIESTDKPMIQPTQIEYRTQLS
jgi:anti-sigma-K factor RskA